MQGGLDGGGEFRYGRVPDGQFVDLCRGHGVVAHEPDGLRRSEPAEPGEGFRAEGQFLVPGGDQLVSMLRCLPLVHVLGILQPAFHHCAVAVLPLPGDVVLVGDKRGLPPV